MQLNSSNDSSFSFNNDSLTSPPPAFDDLPLNIQEKQVEAMRCALIENRQRQLAKFNNVDINRNETSSTSSFRQIENILSPKSSNIFAVPQHSTGTPLRYDAFVYIFLFQRYRFNTDQNKGQGRLMEMLRNVQF